MTYTFTTGASGVDIKGHGKANGTETTRQQGFYTGGLKGAGKVFENEGGNQGGKWFSLCRMRGVGGKKGAACR